MAVKHEPEMKYNQQSNTTCKYPDKSFETPQYLNDRI
jgi:hypothetical protein